MWWCIIYCNNFDFSFAENDPYFCSYIINFYADGYNQSMMIINFLVLSILSNEKSSEFFGDFV